MVISSTSTVQISIQAVSAPLSAGAGAAHAAPAHDPPPASIAAASRRLPARKNTSGMPTSLIPSLGGWFCYKM